MSFKFIALACLFIIPLRFPKRLSLATVIRKRYATETLKTIRKFEQLDFRCRKLNLDVDFLETCRRRNFFFRTWSQATSMVKSKKSMVSSILPLFG